MQFVLWYPRLNFSCLRLIFQRDAGAVVEIAATLDRRREEGRRLHGPSSGRAKQSRGGRRAAGTRREGRSGFAECEPADRVAPSGRAAAYADRQGMFVSCVLLSSTADCSASESSQRDARKRQSGLKVDKST